MRFSIIIATSHKRTDWLINRSLLSVYNQTGVNKSEWGVLIVDDNEDETEFALIQQRILCLRKELHLDPSDFKTTLLKNNRTRFMSGTGAWNTGIFEAYKHNPNGFVCILDDDDEFLPNHISDCQGVINDQTIAVFQRLIWKNEDLSVMPTNLTKDSLTPENFFIGNPGVQGSNMFFKTESLIAIDGFDESLPNTTDRDLMIRFLWKNDLSQVTVLESTGVIHYNHKKQKVNNDFPRKKEGLDLFYKKYRAFFSKEAYLNSLNRAKKFFDYDPPSEQIIICMPVKNAEKTIELAVHSVLQQTNTKREVLLLIGIDRSDDNTENILKNIASEFQNVILLNVDFGKAYLNRNFLNDHARKYYPNCILIGRLDADDFIFDKETISHIEALFDNHDFDVLMCGNKQMKNGVILDWENKPSRYLLKDDFLLNQLNEMSKGNSKAELPSCNTFIKPTVNVEYPDKVSAEDHWFNVLLLLNKEKLNILIDENLIYCCYSLDGLATNDNKKSDIYFQSRVDLYNFFQANK